MSFVEDEIICKNEGVGYRGQREGWNSVYQGSVRSHQKKKKGMKELPGVSERRAEIQ